MWKGLFDFLLVINSNLGIPLRLGQFSTGKRTFLPPSFIQPKFENVSFCTASAKFCMPRLLLTGLIIPVKVFGYDLSVSHNTSVRPTDRQTLSQTLNAYRLTVVTLKCVFVKKARIASCYSSGNRMIEINNKQVILVSASFVSSLPTVSMPDVKFVLFFPISACLSHYDMSQTHPIDFALLQSLQFSDRPINLHFRCWAYCVVTKLGKSAVMHGAFFS